MSDGLRQLAYQGKEGCRDVRCTRIGIGPASRCVGWHCPYCDEAVSMMGHDCPKLADTPSPQQEEANP